MKKKGLMSFLLSSFLIIIFAFSNHNDVSATGLTTAEKEELYKQYQEVIEEVIAEYDVDAGHLEVVPMNEVEETDWVDAQEFKKRAIQVLQLKPTSAFEIISKTPKVSTLGTTSNTVSQVVEFNHGSGIKINVTFKSAFDIVYSTTNKRMVFSGTLVNFTGTANKGTWTAIDRIPSILESGRLLRVEGSGSLTYSSVKAIKTYTIYYIVDTSGTVRAGSI